MSALYGEKVDRCTKMKKITD